MDLARGRTARLNIMNKKGGYKEREEEKKLSCPAKREHKQGGKKHREKEVGTNQDNKNDMVGSSRKSEARRKSGER